jgi:hypothetical protein
MGKFYPPKMFLDVNSLYLSLPLGGASSLLFGSLLQALEREMDLGWTRCL